MEELFQFFGAYLDNLLSGSTKRYSPSGMRKDKKMIKIGIICIINGAFDTNAHVSDKVESKHAIHVTNFLFLRIVNHVRTFITARRYLPKGSRKEEMQSPYRIIELNGNNQRS